jgi:hypothetical protein
MSSTGSSPFAFSRATATPQSKSTSTRESHEMRSTGNVDTTTASSSPSDGSPISAVSPSSSVPSPQDVRGMPMPMPPGHPATGGGRQRPSTGPNTVSLTPAGGLTASRLRQTFEGHHQLRQSIGSEVLQESDREDDRASRSRQPSPAHSRRANAKILFAFFLHLHLSRVLGHPYLVQATAVRHPSHESAALSDPVLVHEIPALVQLQAAGVHDTIHMSVSSAPLALGRSRAH